MDTAINNPLYGVEAGSIFTESGGFGATVLKPGLTAFNKQAASVASLSGTSTYIYSAHMNQGSFSAAGSYGLSGVSKVSGAVTGYLGNASATSGESISIKMNLIKWAGVEYVDFNEIDPADLLAGLQSNAQADAMGVFDAFAKLQSATEGEIRELTASWIRACNHFYQRFGSGIVVGVLWGGWGTVRLDFLADTKSSKWEGGGSARFTYQGPGGAADLSATYGHTEDSIGKNASTSVTAYSNGACVEAAIDKWRGELEKLTLDKIAKEPVISSSAMSGAVKPPAIPEFKKPTPKEKASVAKKIGAITSLEGLETYAKAAAYDKYVKGGGKDTLETFLKSADSKNDTSAIPGGGSLSPVESSGASPSPSPSRVLDEGLLDHGALGAVAGADGGDDPKDPKPPAKPDMSNYQPLGVWTVGWGQLFPWMVSAQDNRIPQDAKFRDVIRLKTLFQDCLSLSDLYRRIGAAGAKLTIKGVLVDFASLSNAFSHGAAEIARFLGAPGSAGVEAEARGTIDRIIKGFGESPGTIYRKWAEVAALRTCELGAGVMMFTHSTGWAGHTIGSLNLGRDKNYGHINAVATAFDLNARNHSAFSTAVKAWPFVLPDGRIGAYICNGVRDTSGFLSAWLGDPVGCYATQTSRADTYTTHPELYPEQDNLLVFSDRRNPGAEPVPGALIGYCRSEVGHRDEKDGWKCTVGLYPIPFEAADGVADWKGSSLTTGMGTLPATLERLRQSLGSLNQWSFDSDSWRGVDWKSYRYSMQTLRPAYVGVVDEVRSVFGPSGAA